MKAIKNWQRYVLEWGILAALIVFILVSHVIGGRINPDTYCPFGGIQAFANLISHGSLPCDISSLQILSGIALLVAVVLFSKLFCAYLCPLGTISDLCRKLCISRKVKKSQSKSQRQGTCSTKIIFEKKSRAALHSTHQTVLKFLARLKYSEPLYKTEDKFLILTEEFMTFETVSFCLTQRLRSFLLPHVFRYLFEYFKGALQTAVCAVFRYFCFRPYYFFRVCK